jgi:prepilin-type N-terminal cleavage/methylation domain-containing protein
MRKKRAFVRGMTLMELIVAMAIMTLAMGAFSLLFIRSWQTNAYVLELGLDASEASRAVNDAVADIRKIRQADDGGYPVSGGDGYNFTAYLDIDNDGITERVHYYLDNARQFKRGITKPSNPPSPTYPNGDQSVAVLAGSIDNDLATEPVFSYYNADYPGDTVHNPLATPITASDVRMVKLRLLVNLYPNHAPNDVSIESFAGLRNLNNYAQ